MKYRFSKKVTDSSVFNNFTFMINNKVKVITIAWSYKFGDWWYDTDPSTAKFFDIERKVYKDHVRYAVYIGQLALVLMKGTTRV